MNDNLVSNLLLIFIIGLVVYRWAYHRFGKQTSASLTLPNDHAYEYVMGDYLPLYGARGSFHGIDVILPQEMPHVYLDSLRGGGRQVRFVIDPSQRITLEGDFRKYYNVFVPKRYESVALSILSPDVMATLEDYATMFDVEIYGSHMRIITNKWVGRNVQRQDALVYVALKVMGEVDQRLASWTLADSREASSQDLRLSPGGGMRFFGRYLTYWSIGWTAYWFIVTIGLAGAGIVALADPNSKKLGVFLLALFGCMLATLIVVTLRRRRAESFRSRRG